MYEFIDNDYKLIRWNKNQEIYTGYNTKELYHMSPHDFVMKEDRDTISNAIEKIFTKGKSGIYANLLTKSGKLIPYYYEGYHFNFGKRKIFIGLSVDVSSQSMLKDKLKSSKIEKELLFDDNIKYKERLLNNSYKFLQFSRMTNILDQQLESALKSNNMEDMKSKIILLRKNIKSQLNKQKYWETPEIEFNQVHPDFMDRLNQKYPDLTKGEIQYCIYLKMNIPPLEIASLFKISAEGLKKKKYRIRKKFNLNRSDSLKLYISNL